MQSDLGELTSKAAAAAAASASSSSSGASGNEVGEFECNICFELAQDPVVTRCGHLYCWPCLYRWLRHHSNCHECPVCKALIQKEKLVPLYSRGKTQIDPRLKSYPRIDVPRRPSGQRPQTASVPPQGVNQFPSFGFGLLGGFVPISYAGIENFAITTALGGLIPALFNVQFHGFRDAAVYGTTSSYPLGFNTFNNGRNSRGFQQPGMGGQEADNVLNNLLIMVGVFVVLALLFW